MLIANSLKDAPDFVKETLASMEVMDISRQDAGELVLYTLLESMIEDSRANISNKKARVIAEDLCDFLCAFTHNEPDALAWMLAAINGMSYKSNAGVRLHQFDTMEYGNA